MKTQLIDPNFRHGCYEFCFPKLDTLVLVEENDDLVVVRATRDTFTERRKIFFIRELAAEGFISDEYRQVETISAENYLPVRWLIDYSWLIPAAKVLAARTRRIMVGMLGGATLLWLVMMGSLLFSAR